MDVIRKEVDPEMERLRNDALQSCSPDMINVNISGELKQLTKEIHSVWLFHQWGRDVLQSLCESLSSLPADKNGSWYHFAGVLDIQWEKIQCIFSDQSCKDKTELTLLTYAQYKNSTLAQVISVLIEIKRLDVLTKIHTSVSELVNKIMSEVGRQYWYTVERSSNMNTIQQHDSGFSSLEEDTTRNNMLSRTIVSMPIKPRGYKNVQFHLPITLRALHEEHHSPSRFSEVASATENVPKMITLKENVSYQQAVQTTVTKPSREIQFKKVIFLTFTDDGQHVAQRIASTLRRPRSGRSPFGVLILDENAEKLQGNPELLIRSLFDQVDYIMPIITAGYLESIKFSLEKQTTSRTDDMFSSLDQRYAQYINDLMRKYYIQNGCFNDKFRCIINNIDQNSGVENLLNNKLFRHEPTLKAWAFESDLEELAVRLMNS